MEFEVFCAIFDRLAAQNGLIPNVSRETFPSEAVFPSEMRIAFHRFIEHLLQVNREMNLTAIRDPEEAIRLHLIDSLMLLSDLPEGATVYDIGCGAGFPSVPIAIARPDLSVLAIDSTDKKVRFVSSSAVLLGLSNLRAETARAEALGQGELRESADIVTARAVSNLRALSELCLPLVKIGGSFLSMKGASWREEYADAERAILLLGGKSESVREFPLLGGEVPEQRAILQIRKAKATPERYPRDWAQIKKRPL